MKKDICSLDFGELAEEIAGIGEPSFRSRQIFEWLHVKLADSFDEMTNLSKKLRERLDSEYEIPVLRTADHQISIMLPSASSNRNFSVGSTFEI